MAAITVNVGGVGYTFDLVPVWPGHELHPDEWKRVAEYLNGLPAEVDRLRGEIEDLRGEAATEPERLDLAYCRGVARGEQPLTAEELADFVNRGGKVCVCGRAALKERTDLAKRGDVVCETTWTPEYKRGLAL